MHKLFHYFLFIVLGTNISGAYSEPVDNPEAIVKGYITQYMHKKNVRGVAVALYYHGKPYFYNYGYANETSPVSRDTEFGIASITKVFTATLFALDIIDNRSSFDDKLINYLHDESLNSLPAGQITLGQLASYTSSLPESIPQKSLTEIKSFLSTWKPKYPIGTHFIYSNLGFALLGYAASQAAHQEFIPMLQQEILNPLKMTSSGIGTPNQGPHTAAQGYDQLGKPVPYWLGAPFSVPAGQIYSNTNDMMQFLKANLGIPGTGASSRLLQALSLTQQPVFKLSAKRSLGLGWGQFTLPNGQIAVNKNGAFRGFGTFISMVPKKKMGIVILANINGMPAVKAGLAIMNALSNES